MRTLVKSTLPVLMVAILTACGSKSGEHSGSDSAHDHHQHEKETEKSDQPSALATLKDDRLNAVYQHYVHLTTALIHSDAKEAKVASSAIEAGMAGWPEGAGVAKLAGSIVETNDIEAQRVLYSSLSDGFIKLVRTAGLQSGELFVDFCPMANKDKGGYWLSSKKEISNPYFGEKMASCGEIKETLK